MRPRLSSLARSRRMLGADEPATSRISSTVAEPVRSRNLMMSSQRGLSVSAISHRFYLFGEVKIKPKSDFFERSVNFFRKSLNELTNFFVYDRFLGPNRRPRRNRSQMSVCERFAHEMLREIY